MYKIDYYCDGVITVGQVVFSDEEEVLTKLVKHALVEKEAYSKKLVLDVYKLALSGTTIHDNKFTYLAKKVTT